MVSPITIPPLDPYNFTGPVRLMSGIARIRAVILDQPFDEYARWIYVGTTGNVSIVTWEGATVLLKGLASGFFHPIYALKVNTAGTTALDLLWGS